MKGFDVVGLPYKEGIDLLNTVPDHTIQVINTYGLNKKYDTYLTDPRILRASIINNTVTVVVGYF